MLENSLVIVGADHGDAFGSHGFYGHPRRLFEELLHVPLILSSPVDDSGVELPMPVQNADIGPTILQALDVDIPEKFRGTPLALEGDKPYEGSPPHPGVAFAQASGEGAMSEINRHTVRTDKFKLHVDVTSTTDEQTVGLYHLTDDPDELTDVSEAYSTELSRLQDLLAEHVQSFDSRSDRRHDDVDDAVSNRLKELGYR
jgi:arylsulfatase A-like enzyme